MADSYKVVITDDQGEGQPLDLQTALTAISAISAALGTAYGLPVNTTPGGASEPIVKKTTSSTPGEETTVEFTVPLSNATILCPKYTDDQGTVNALGVSVSMDGGDSWLPRMPGESYATSKLSSIIIKSGSPLAPLWIINAVELVTEA
jgi:hypothetical protein